MAVFTPSRRRCSYWSKAEKRIGSTLGIPSRRKWITTGWHFDFTCLCVGSTFWPLLNLPVHRSTAIDFARSVYFHVLICVLLPGRRRAADDIRVPGWSLSNGRRTGPLWYISQYRFKRTARNMCACKYTDNNVDDNMPFLIYFVYGALRTDCVSASF